MLDTLLFALFNKTQNICIIKYDEIFMKIIQLPKYIFTLTFLHTHPSKKKLKKPYISAPTKEIDNFFNSSGFSPFQQSSEGSH